MQKKTEGKQQAKTADPAIVRFVQQVGGIDKARQILDALAAIRKAA